MYISKTGKYQYSIHTFVTVGKHWGAIPHLPYLILINNSLTINNVTEIIS